MNECDYNHLLLYAKGWYQRSNVIEDVRKILGHRCDISPKYVPNSDVWEQLVSAFLKYCDGDYDVRGLLLDMFRPWAGETDHSPFTFWTDASSFERMVHLILGRLGNVKMTNTQRAMYLGEPNPKILPLSAGAEKEAKSGK